MAAAVTEKAVGEKVIKSVTPGQMVVKIVHDELVRMLGGNPESDGLNHGNNPISTATIPPAEILESLYPVIFTQWALRPDSGGPGFNRGGLGAIGPNAELGDEQLADNVELF